jgi:hypothetical protein
MIVEKQRKNNPFPPNLFRKWRMYMKKDGKTIQLGEELEKRMRKKEIARENQITGKQEELISQLKELTGEEWGVHKKKSQNSKVAFAQLITDNILVLSEHDYITTGEKAFLFEIAAYVDFKSNVLVKKEFRKKNKNEVDDNILPDQAGPTYFAEVFGKARQPLSTMMNKLKNKGILATAESGVQTEDRRVCTSRTWFINPRIICCGPKDDIDRATKMIFKGVLTSFPSKVEKDKNGKAKMIKLPVQLF